MDEAKLQEIEARANAATPGPWIGDGEFGFVFQRGASRAHCIARLDHEDVRDTSGADLAFIAHARTDVPALIAEVRRLRAEHAAALDAARREGAEGMREAAVAMIGRRITAWDDDADECGDEDAATRWEEATAIRDAIRALPLDAPGGAS